MWKEFNMLSNDPVDFMQKRKKDFLSVNILKTIALIGIIIAHLDWTNVNKAKILYSYWVSPAFTFLITIFAYQSAQDFIERNIFDWYSPQYFTKLIKRFIPAYVLLIACQLLINSVFIGQPIRTGFYTILTEGAFGPGGYYFLILLQLFYVFPFYLYLARDYPMIGFTALVIFSVIYPLWPADKLTPLLYTNLFFRFSIALFLGSALSFHWESLKKTALPIFALIFGFFYFVLQDLSFDFQLFNRSKDLEGSLYPGLYVFGILFFFLSNEERFIKLNDKIRRLFFVIGDSAYHILVFQLFFFSFLNTPFNAVLTELLGIGASPRIRIITEFLTVVPFCILAGIFFYLFQAFIFRKFFSNPQSQFQTSKESVDGE